MTKTANLTKKLSFPTQSTPALFKVGTPVKAAKKTVAKKAQKVTLKPTVEVGSVVILLAGRFKGKRVVVLKQLESGLLLVNGPFAVNGVPLKRVNQRYVIGTSTKVDVSSVDVSSITDAFFARESEKTYKNIFGADGKVVKNEITAARKDAQKKVDAALKAAVAKVEDLEKYLGARFTLRNNMYPHALKF